jgi:CRP-like cAMP-binding protein
MGPNQIFLIQNFHQGSYITVEGDRKIGHLHIILEGRVNLHKKNPANGEPAYQSIGKGDFFGVISAMTGLPHLESAIAVTPITTISVTHDKFGDLIRKNAPLALKIIKSYSLKLRLLDQLTNTESPLQSSKEDPYSDLIQRAEKHLQFGDKKIALRLYKLYLSYSPEGKMRTKCLTRLSNLNETEELAKKSGNVLSYKPGEVVFAEGEIGKELYIVQTGKVKIVRMSNDTEMVINILKEGEIFGEMSLLDNKPRSATAVALTSVKVASISKLNFQSTAELNPQLMTKVITVLSERVWTLYRKVVNSKIDDMGLRIGDMLMILAEQSRVKFGAGVKHNFQISPKELCKMMAMPDSELTSILKFISLQNFLSNDGDQINCSDLSVLERYVKTNLSKLEKNENTRTHR